MRKFPRLFALLSVTLVFLGVSSCMAQEKKTPPSEPSKSGELNVNWLYGAYVPKEVPLISLTGKQRFRLFLRQSFTTPGIYIKTIAFSMSDQINGSPSAWGGGMAGYGRRAGSRHAQSLIHNSLSATGNAILRYEPRYDRCRCTGLWPRTLHAFMRNFVTYNRTEKELRPQFALYAGALGSGAISSTWLPGKPSPLVKGYQSMITQAGWGLAVNWVGEFAPDIMRIIKRK